LANMYFRCGFEGEGPVNWVRRKQTGTSTALAFLNLRRGLLDGRNDVRIRGAATNIAAHIFADIIVAGSVAFLDAGDRRHDLARRAVAALERVLLDEGLLHRMQLVAGGQPLDGGDLAAL